MDTLVLIYLGGTRLRHASKSYNTADYLSTDILNFDFL